MTAGAMSMPSTGAGAAARPLPPVGLLGLLATVIMLFTSFTTAYLVRSNGSDWVRIALPSMVWLSTALLVASSVTIEIAKRRGAGWLVASGALAVGFVVAQLGAWWQISAAGVDLRANAHGAFFYLLTGAHAVHLIGALGGLIWAAGKPARIGLLAIFWHVILAIWVYLLLLLSSF